MFIRQTTDLAVRTDLANTFTSAGRSIGLLDDTTLVALIHGLSSVGKFETAQIATTLSSGASLYLGHREKNTGGSKH